MGWTCISMDFLGFSRWHVLPMETPARILRFGFQARHRTESLDPMRFAFGRSGSTHVGGQPGTLLTLLTLLEVSERFSSSTHFAKYCTKYCKGFGVTTFWCMRRCWSLQVPKPGAKKTLARLRKIRFCWQADGVKRHQETFTEVFPWGLRRHFWRQETV